jgi:two-component system, NarL family, nitrate/nitrite response regulator NarL
MRVLICDDHTVFAESLGHLLTTMNREVAAVTDHPDLAVGVLRREPVDLLLLDVMFGTENALDRLADLREAAPTTRIVLLCALVDDQLVAAGQTAGVWGVLDKRQPVAEIVAVLDRVYRGETVMPDIPGAASPPSAQRRPVPNDEQRLAAFLTRREREVLSALVRGVDTARIARTLGIANSTARCHIQAVLIKLGVHSRLEAAAIAVRCGLVNPHSGEWLIPSR